MKTLTPIFIVRAVGSRDHDSVWSTLEAARTRVGEIPAAEKHEILKVALDSAAALVLE